MTIRKTLNTIKFELIAVIFSVWGIYYRMQSLHHRDLSPDELNQLNNTTGPLRSLFDRSYNGELTAFPGDYFLKWPFIQLLGSEDKWLVNAPHYIIMIIGFWLFYKIGKRHLTSAIAFTFGFIFMAFNQTLVYHALEFRPYAVLPTMALTIFYLNDIITSEHKTLSLWKKYTIGALFLFFTIYHAYGLMIITTCALFFILKNKQSSWSTWLKELSAFYGIFFLCAIPAFLYYATGVPWFNQEHTAGRGIETFAYIPDPRTEPNSFFRTVLGHLRGFKMYKTKLLQYGIIIVCLIPNKHKRDQLLFLLGIIIAPITLILISDMMKGYWFVQRQFVWAMPLFAFLIAWCWDTIIQWLKTAPWKRLAFKRP